LRAGYLFRKSALRALRRSAGLPLTFAMNSIRPAMG